MDSYAAESLIDAINAIADQLISTRALYVAEWIEAAEIVAATELVDTFSPLKAARALQVARFPGGVTGADLQTICAMAAELRKASSEKQS